MGEPVRIDDVARRMVEQSGRPVDIIYTGLRPGEKLHEALVSRDEDPCPTAHPLISAVTVAPESPATLQALAALPTEDVARVLFDLANGVGDTWVPEDIQTTIDLT